MAYKLVKLAVLAIALHPLAARADEVEMPAVSLSGFGTFGFVHSSERNADFTNASSQPNGAGHSRRWSNDVDSRIAAQASAAFTPSLSAVLQVIAEQNYENTYRPHVEWANLKYQFMVTDSRNIGYANPWVRPPVEVYSLAPVTSNDGVDASYRMPIGGAFNTVQVAAGQERSRFPDGAGGHAIADARRLVSLVDTLEYDFVTLHFNYGQASITVRQFAPLFGAFRQFGAQGASIADKYELIDHRVSFGGVGASYDPGNWFLMGEWGRVNTNSVIGNSTAWYVSGGYRVGRFTPYAIYARVKLDSNTADPGLSLAGLPSSFAAIAANLNGALNSVLGSRPVQSTTSLGGRWDLIDNAAVKLQFDHTRHGEGSPGTLINLQPAFERGGNVNVLSATIDFVF